MALITLINNDDTGDCTLHKTSMLGTVIWWWYLHNNSIVNYFQLLTNRCNTVYANCELKSSEHVNHNTLLLLLLLLLYLEFV